MKKKSFSLCFALVGLLLAGCDNLQSGRRLRLPTGSAENGKVAFLALNCTACHTVAGVELPKPTIKPEDVVALGGNVSRLRTVGDLLTSIIHPTRGTSFQARRADNTPVKVTMPTVNDVMTVSQLIDLVRFLQPRYSEIEPPIDWIYSH